MRVISMQNFELFVATNYTPYYHYGSINKYYKPRAPVLVFPHKYIRLAFLWCSPMYWMTGFSSLTFFRSTVSDVWRARCVFNVLNIWCFIRCAHPLQIVVRSILQRKKNLIQFTYILHIIRWWNHHSFIVGCRTVCTLSDRPTKCL